MKRLFLLILLLAAFVQAQSQAPESRPRRIAVFGSSVANGTGDEFNREGYTGLLREMLALRGWEVLNQSRGGDTTKTMAPRFAPDGVPDPRTRYLLPVNPGYVVIGLSLANEGIWEAKTKAEKDAVFNQYAEGIKGFIERSRQNNIIPIVALVYPRMAYTAVEYDYVKRMNLLQNSWAVPTVNLLGALDDGAGRYTTGFDFDDKHPNAAGHKELFYTFVPTLFEALEKGKPSPAKPAGPVGFTRISGGVAPLTFTASDTMHSFALGFSVRAQGDGTVAAVHGSLLAAKNETKKLERAGSREIESITLTPDKPFVKSIEVLNGKWTYKAADGSSITSTINADAQWHHIVLSHYTARGETLFFVDGTLIGKVRERLQPNEFVIGSSRQADFKNLYLFRSALNSDEVAALRDGKVLQASLEVYSPLNDAQFQKGALIENRAQSMTGFKVGAGRILRVNEAVSQQRQIN